MMLDADAISQILSLYESEEGPSDFDRAGAVRHLVREISSEVEMRVLPVGWTCPGIDRVAKAVRRLPKTDPNRAHALTALERLRTENGQLRHNANQHAECSASFADAIEQFLAETPGVDPEWTEMFKTLLQSERTLPRRT